MNLDNYVAVSGMSGVYKVVANRSNGLVIEDLDTGKVKFAPSRQHQFTPLASIGIFTNGENETANLSEVFTSMLSNLEKTPLVDQNASKDELMNYLAAVLPDYDRDRVYPGDVKKLVKWFVFLNERGALTNTETTTETSGEADDET